MNDERNEVIVQEAAAPRWMGIAVVALAVISLVGLGVGWSASNRSKALEQSLSSQTQQFTQFKQGDDVLGQRLAKAEDTNAQLQGELSVVTDKMKLTETELGRARTQAKKIREDDDQATGRPAEQRERAARDQGQRRRREQDWEPTSTASRPISKPPRTT